MWSREKRSSRAHIVSHSIDRPPGFWLVDWKGVVDQFSCDLGSDGSGRNSTLFEQDLGMSELGLDLMKGC